MCMENDRSNIIRLANAGRRGRHDSGAPASPFGIVQDPPGQVLLLGTRRVARISRRAEDAEAAEAATAESVVAAKTVLDLLRIAFTAIIVWATMAACVWLIVSGTL